MYNDAKYVKTVKKEASQTLNGYNYYQYSCFYNTYILPFISYLEENID